ncbi:MAG: archaemetzincin family Zn-dependent metalloprotease [Thermoproteota archaeon]
MASMESSQQVIHEVSPGVERVLNREVRYFGDLPLPPEAYNPFRSQYNSSLILNSLRRIVVERGVDYLMALTSVDLYSSTLNFVFGEAELNGNVAVVSYHRLDGALLNRGGKQLFLDRLTKEVVHEFGHVAGLKHCGNPTCVMTFSNHVLDTDRKSKMFCRNCLQAYERFLAVEEV